MELTPQPSIVILGDMLDLHHHGCEAVVAELSEGLARHGRIPTHTLAGLQWQKNREICESADLVVINGEGALHGNRPAVANVIELAKLRNQAGKSTVLLNTSWFQNSPDSSLELSEFSLVVARESESAGKIVNDGGPLPMLVPDLAIAYAIRSHVRHHGGGPVMVSDSTKPERTKQLRSLATSLGWDYLPVLVNPITPRSGAKSQKIVRRARMAKRLGPLASFLLDTRYHAHAVGVTETREYLRRMASSNGVVTGRFHTVCFALAMGVPFIAVASNTPKIEAIVRDAGLDPMKRVLPLDEFMKLDNVPAFDEQESAALEEFTQRALMNENSMFERIALL